MRKKSLIEITIIYLRLFTHTCVISGNSHNHNWENIISLIFCITTSEDRLEIRQWVKCSTDCLLSVKITNYSKDPVPNVFFRSDVFFFLSVRGSKPSNLNLSFEFICSNCILYLHFPNKIFFIPSLISVLKHLIEWEIRVGVL